MLMTGPRFDVPSPLSLQMPSWHRPTSVSAVPSNLNGKGNSGSGETCDGKSRYLRPAGTGSRSGIDSGGGGRCDDGREPRAGQGGSGGEAALAMPVVAVRLAPKRLGWAGLQGGCAGASDDGCGVEMLIGVIVVEGDVVVVVIRMVGGRSGHGAGGSHSWPVTVPGGSVS